MAYLFEQFSEEYYRLINQTGVKQALLPEGYEKYNACWDGAVAPDGTFYISIASEGGRSEYAQLNSYTYEENEIKRCMYSADLILPTAL